MKRSYSSSKVRTTISLEPKTLELADQLQIIKRGELSGFVRKKITLEIAMTLRAFAPLWNCPNCKAEFSPLMMLECPHCRRCIRDSEREDLVDVAATARLNFLSEEEEKRRQCVLKAGSIQNVG